MGKLADMDSGIIRENNLESTETNNVETDAKVRNMIEQIDEHLTEFENLMDELEKNNDEDYEKYASSIKPKNITFIDSSKTEIKKVDVK